jgi:hypothetical protein
MPLIDAVSSAFAAVNDIAAVPEPLDISCPVASSTMNEIDASPNPGRPSPPVADDVICKPENAAKPPRFTAKT